MPRGQSSQSEASDTNTSQETNKVLEADTQKIKHKIRVVISTKEKITITPAKFIKKLNRLLEVCTEGGTNVDGVPITFHDEGDPFCIFTIAAFQGEKDLTTSFLVRKEDIYLVGYIFGENYEEDSWTLLKNSNVTMINPPNPTTSPFNLTYNRSALKDEVGPSILLQALSMLRSKDVGDRAEGFQSICYHIAEAVRFFEIQWVVGKSMKNRYFESLQLTSDQRDMMNHWDDMSSSLISTNSIKEKNLLCGRRENPAMKASRKTTALQTHSRMIRSTIKDFRKDAPKIDEIAKGIMINRKKVSDGVKLDDVSVDILIDELKVSQGGHKGTWVSLRNALVHPGDKMAEMIINNTPIFVIQEDLSISVGYEGLPYSIPDDGMSQIRAGR